MRKLILFVVFFFLYLTMKAQDRHYWSQMGGISASLLGGSAIAGLKDNSSLYYNAATMSFVNNPSISLGANTYRLRVTNIDNALGKDLNQLTNQFVVNPDLVGGLLFSKKNDQLRFGYAINSRFIHENNVNLQSSRTFSDGTTYVGDFDSHKKGQETWFNAANSYKVNEHFALGTTVILAFRSQQYSNNLGSKLIPTNQLEEVSRFDSRIIYNYWNVKALLRLSAALNYENTRFGWNLTLPSLNLLGGANIKREISLVNNPNLVNTLPSNVVVTGSAYGINALHKYPLSSAVGASFKIPGLGDWVHLSAEVFMPLKKYTVFTSSDKLVSHPESSFDSLNNYFSPSTFLNLSEQAKFVINFSAGYETFISSDFGLLTGFRTDFNFNAAEDYDLGEIRPYFSNWDIYYLSAGVWGYVKGHKITTGLEVGLTPKTQMRQLFNYDEIDSSEYPLSGEPNTSARASQLTIQLYLGFEINFDHKSRNK